MNKKPKDLNILVTGCGGDIGFGVGKILVKAGYGKRLIGTDISDDHGGFVVFNECIIVPKANSLDYLAELKKLIERYSIDVLIPCSEAETKVILENATEMAIAGALIIAPNREAFDICSDKLKTANFLKDHKLPYPWTKVVGKDDPVELPCIIKQRVGAGSKNIGIVTKENIFLYRQRVGDIWQELLLPDDEEYTCGIFRSSKEIIHTITFRRKLNGGHTVSGQLVENQEIKELLTRVAEHLKLVGSINAQLRLTKKGPVIFEINPRFSSTLVFRHLLGFQDVIWSIDDKVGLPLKTYAAPSAGIRIYRYSEEIVIK